MTCQGAGSCHKRGQRQVHDRHKSFNGHHYPGKVYCVSTDVYRQFFGVHSNAIIMVIEEVPEHLICLGCFSLFTTFKLFI